MALTEPSGTDMDEPLLTLRTSGAADRQTRTHEELGRIPQGVHLVCFSGWKYQEEIWSWSLKDPG